MVEQVEEKPPPPPPALVRKTVVAEQKPDKPPPLIKRNVVAEQKADEPEPEVPMCNHDVTMVSLPSSFTTRLSTLQCVKTNPQ